MEEVATVTKKRRRAKDVEPIVFDGFEYANPALGYTQIANGNFAILTRIDTLSEVKVILFLMRNTWGYQEFDQEKAITVDEFVNGRGTAKELPQFVLLYLPDDHTGGTRPARPTPQASVADNDLAVGRVVDAVSHSAYWDDTAIFVIEDDAQDGADHVDAHRSTAYVISKYAPHMDRPFVDSHFYTTVSMIHTMEELLGLPPMNLFDAHAPLMAPLFSGPGTQAPFQADDKNLRSGLIYHMNQKNAPGAKESLKMDLSRPDAANAALLNGILWRNEKGDLAMPAAVHAHATP